MGSRPWPPHRAAAAAATPVPRRFINEGIDEAWRSPRAAARLALDAVTLLSPVTDDRQFVCQGINYASHVRESGMDPDKIGFNTLFTKASSCLVSARRRRGAAGARAPARL